MPNRREPDLGPAPALPSGAGLSGPIHPSSGAGLAGRMRGLLPVDRGDGIQSHAPGTRRRRERAARPSRPAGAA